MLKKIDHLGIAVNSLHEYMDLYRNILGMRFYGEETIEDQKVKVALFKVGETKIELLESTCPDGPIARHISLRGPGLQHIAYHVLNVEEAIFEMKKRGVIMIDEQPRIGAGGARIAFMHPKSTKGILIELCEYA